MTISAYPQPGDIGLTNIHGPVGKLIEVGQWLNGDGFQPWEHCYLVLDRDQLIEARPGGARIVPLSTYDPGHVLYVAPAGLTAAQRNAVAQVARRYEGVEYGFADYLALAAHRIHLPAPGLRHYIESDHSMICSQLCDRAYRDAGIELFADGRWPGYVTPLALYDRLCPPADGVLEGASR